jgi:carboxymethylenebutenolidase
MCSGQSKGYRPAANRSPIRDTKDEERTRHKVKEFGMTILSTEQQTMVDLFQRHVNAELAGDLDTTMATMTDDPHLHNVPSMIGGVGRDGVRAFYRDHLVGKFFPPDVTMTDVSRTVGSDQVVDEVVISFTHTTPIDWLLPGVPPTGKRVEMAVAVIVGFKDGKISHEHIYWDQASVLVQIGLLDPAGLPVCGAEGARRVLNPKLPPRRM